MKILYVLDSFPKLSETFILNEITELLSRNIEVEILALNDPHETVINGDVSKFNLLDRTRYFRLPPPSKLKLLYGLTPSFYKTLLKAYNRYKPFSFTHLIRLAYYSLYYSNVDLIHAHFAYRAAIVGAQISELTGKPFTFTAHAYELFNQNHYSQHRLQMLSNTANKIFTPSEFNKRFIMNETAIPEERIEIIRATILSDVNIKKNSFDKRDNEIKITSVGRLVEKKGFEYLIKAMNIIAERSVPVKLSIIGEGGLKSELTELSRNLKLDGRIEFLGAKSNEECLQEIADSDIVVLPCVIAKNGDMDVCPLSLQEAMAMEIPVVSTRTGSIQELIENGKEGLLVSERDEAALAGAILELIENPAQRTELGKKGREKIIGEFNICTQMNKQMKIWQRILHDQECSNE